MSRDIDAAYSRAFDRADAVRDFDGEIVPEADWQTAKLRAAAKRRKACQHDFKPYRFPDGLVIQRCRCGAVS